MQGNNGEIDIENRYMDMGRGEERVRCMERVTLYYHVETYITICKTDSQPEFALWLRKLKQGLYINQEDGMDRVMRGRFKRERIYVYLGLIHVEI